MCIVSIMVIGLNYRFICFQCFVLLLVNLVMRFCCVSKMLIRMFGIQLWCCDNRRCIPEIMEKESVLCASYSTKMVWLTYEFWTTFCPLKSFLVAQPTFSSQICFWGRAECCSLLSYSWVVVYFSLDPLKQRLKAWEGARSIVYGLLLFCTVKKGSFVSRFFKSHIGSPLKWISCSVCVAQHAKMHRSVNKALVQTAMA